MADDQLREPIDDEKLRAIIDSALDEIGSVRPAPHFLPRLRAHLEHAPRGSVNLWRLRAAVTVVIVAIVVVAASWRTPREVSIPAPTRPAAVAEPVGLAVQRPNSGNTHEPPAVSFTSPKRSVRHIPRQRARSVREPEVLVPAGQHQAVARLFEALRAGRPEVVSMLLRLPNGGAAVDAPRELTIVPLQIEPVAISSVSER